MFFFFQAEDGIRDLVRSRGLGDVYKRQAQGDRWPLRKQQEHLHDACDKEGEEDIAHTERWICLLYTSDAADERSSVDLGGRRIIKKKNKQV